jgi:DNA-binding NtrC family response regulator
MRRAAPLDFQDFLYRLNVVPIAIPSLRERAADIPILVEYFIARFGKKMGKEFQAIEKRTLKILQEYDWPGNVRELQNVIERAVTLSDSEVFTVDEAWLKRGPSEDRNSSQMQCYMSWRWYSACLDGRGSLMSTKLVDSPLSDTLNSRRFLWRIFFNDLDRLL